MSKTDKTRPWMVRATERPGVTCVPVHSHEDGVCDLPEDPREAWGFSRTGCYWAEGDAFLYGRGRGCGCRMCTGHVWRRNERRANRHAAARVCADAVRIHAADGVEGIEDFDAHVEAKPYW